MNVSTVTVVTLTRTELSDLAPIVMGSTDTDPYAYQDVADALGGGAADSSTGEVWWAYDGQQVRVAFADADDARMFAKSVEVDL